MVRRKTRRKIASQLRTIPPAPLRPNERWSMDFVSDVLVDGRRFRTLNVLDMYTREAVAMEVAFSLPAGAVTRALDRAIAERTPATRSRSATAPRGWYIQPVYRQSCPSSSPATCPTSSAAAQAAGVALLELLVSDCSFRGQRYCKPTRTRTTPFFAFSGVMALPRIAPRARLRLAAFMA